MVEIFQNIRKIYNFVAPCGELADHIEFFSESSLSKTQQYFQNEHFNVKMFASWTPTFYINLGAPYYIDLAHSRYLVKACEDILILRNGTVERHNQPTDNIFTVKFYPGGLEAVLGLNQITLANQLIDLAQVLPGNLLAKIRQSVVFEERVSLMQQYLLNAYRKNKPQDHYLAMVSNAIGEYQATGMQLNTSAVAERLFISSKTINRYFHRTVGVSPKNYFSILRARTALTQFIKTKESFVPFDYGYYDMSHFYKDVVKFTGQKLTDNQP
jgi:AraC-like DNA-binding protein